MSGPSCDEGHTSACQAHLAAAHQPLRAKLLQSFDGLWKQLPQQPLEVVALRCCVTNSRVMVIWINQCRTVTSVRILAIHRLRINPFGRDPTLGRRGYTISRSITSSTSSTCRRQKRLSWRRKDARVLESSHTVRRCKSLGQ